MIRGTLAILFLAAASAFAIESGLYRGKEKPGAGDWVGKWAGAPLTEAGVTWRMLEEPRTKIAFPRILKMRGSSKLAGVNGVLAARHVSEVAQALDCLAQAGAESPLGGSYEAKVHVSHVSSRYFSFTLEEDYYCGGAYPDGRSTGVILDLAESREIDLADYFSVLGADGKYNPRFYQAAVHAEMAKASAAEREDRKDCAGQTGDDGVPGYANFSFALSKTGPIFLTNDFPHAIRVCDLETVIPWSTMRQFAVQGKPFACPGAANYYRPTDLR